MTFLSFVGFVSFRGSSRFWGRVAFDSYEYKGRTFRKPGELRVDWTNLPEGGLRNGGTLVVKGDDVVYQWSDKIPSDVPDVEDVLRIARNAAKETA